MRPHEETLETAPYNDSQECLISTSDGRMIVTFRASEAEAWIRFMRQAPAMARALLNLGHWRGDGEWHIEECHLHAQVYCTRACVSIRKVLTDAGVLP